MGTSQEKRKFKDFKRDVLKHDNISTEELWNLIRRHTQGNMGRNFFNQTLKHRYYKFWIKMLDEAGTIQENGFNMWKVNPFDKAKAENGRE